MSPLQVIKFQSVERFLRQILQSFEPNFEITGVEKPFSTKFLEHTLIFALTQSDTIFIKSFKKYQKQRCFELTQS